jgi:hypothetical protein
MSFFIGLNFLILIEQIDAIMLLFHLALINNNIIKKNYIRDGWIDQDRDRDHAISLIHLFLDRDQESKII